MNRIDPKTARPNRPIRIGICLSGLVQDVGFRPHVHRLAKELHLQGWILNNSRGVTIELEGSPEAVRLFMPRLENELPPHTTIISKQVTHLSLKPGMGFQIRESEASGEVAPLILPDIAVCRDCLAEMYDPSNRGDGIP